MVATRDRRAGTLDLLGDHAGPRRGARPGAAASPRSAPARLALVLNAALFVALLADDEFARRPSVWHVVQAPLTVLGACLLGTMLGVWAPRPVDADRRPSSRWSP